MSIRLTKPWRDLTSDAVRRLPGQLGVFEIGDAGGNVIHIGYAGGRSRFGLRSAVEAAVHAAGPAAVRFRYEITMQYMSRYQELLMLHAADHGGLPPGNRQSVAALGRLRPH